MAEKAYPPPPNTHTHITRSLASFTAAQPAWAAAASRHRITPSHHRITPLHHTWSSGKHSARKAARMLVVMPRTRGVACTTWAHARLKKMQPPSPHSIRHDRLSQPPLPSPPSLAHAVEEMSHVAEPPDPHPRPEMDGLIGHASGAATFTCPCSHMNVHT
eukprot:363402-Chlamydomonas_euryale.AAC.2